MAKPPLTVIGHAGTGREPPIVLGERGRALWDSLRREFVIADAAGIELLAQAGAAADRAEALRAAIDRDGEVVQTRTGAACASRLTRRAVEPGVYRSDA